MSEKKRDSFCEPIDEYHKCIECVGSNEVRQSKN